MSGRIRSIFFEESDCAMSLIKWLEQACYQLTAASQVGACFTQQHAPQQIMSSVHSHHLVSQRHYSSFKLVSSSEKEGC